MIGFNRREKKAFRYALFFHLFGVAFRIGLISQLRRGA